MYASAGFPADPRAFWLIPASLGVYHGALALNDWNDRDHDGRTRPGRPVPSGAIAPTLALAVGLLLIVAGIACAYLAAPSSAVWMGVVALLAVTYDLVGRGPRIGPSLLALCRAGNLGSGVWWAFASGTSSYPVEVAFAPAVLYGGYVFLVSRLGRLEDGEDARPLRKRPKILLEFAAACLILIGIDVSGGAPLAVRAATIALGFSAAIGLLHAARRTDPWTHGAVESAMGLALRRLLVASSSIALAATRPAAEQGNWDGAIAAGVILLGFPASHALRRVAPPS